MPRGRSKNFTITLDIGGKTYEVSGPTIEKCLRDLPLKFAKSTGYLTVQQGDKKLVRLFTPLHVRKLKVNKIYPELFAKQIQSAFT